MAETGLIVNQSTRLVIMIMMIIAVGFAYFQMTKLDVNESAHNSLDNFLCLMCLPAFFVFGVFSMIPGIIYSHVLAVISVLSEVLTTIFLSESPLQSLRFLQVIQVVIQTTFIIDGMSRSSNTKQLRKQKPGREFVIFLAICNVAMWIMQTFEVKSHGMDNYRQDFYSREMWSIIGHSCLPLMMFYRYFRVFGALKGKFQIAFFADFTRQFVSSIFGNTPTCLQDISLINKFVVNIIVTGISNIYFSRKFYVYFLSAI